MRFRLTWRGQIFTDADVLAMDLVTVQALLGDGWANATPFTGPAQVLAFTAALVARTSDRPFDEVLDEIRNAPADELVTAFEPVNEETDGVH